MRRRLLLSLLAALCGSAQAQDTPALYQCTTIVTGTDTRQRPQGFSDCLLEVLVKVSGAPRLRDDPAVAALASDAESLVGAFSYVDPRAWFLHHDDQGTYDRSYELTVRFDPEKTDAVLIRLGAPPWRGPRPLLTPVILVRRNDVPFLLSATAPRGVEMRQTVVRLAAENGFGVHFPTEEELAAWGVGLIGPPAPLATPDAQHLLITGSLDWSVKALGWVGTWQVHRDGATHDWQISGVGFDLAFSDMVRGAVPLARGAPEEQR